MKKNLFYGAAIAALTALNAYDAEAQGTRPKPTNRVLSKCPEYSATGEGMLIKDYVFSNAGGKNLDRLMSCLYAERGGLTFDTVDAKKGIERMLVQLKARGTQVSREKTASLAYLEDLKGKISEGTYLVFARSRNSQLYQDQSLAFLVDGSRPASTEQIADSSRTQKTDSLTAADSTAKRDSTQTTADSLKTIQDQIAGRDTSAKARADSAYQADLAKTRATEDSIARARVDSVQPETGGRDFRITADYIHHIHDESLKGGAVGFRYGSFGLVFNGATRPDTQTMNVTVPLSNGREGRGTEGRVGHLYGGVGAEFHLPSKWIFKYPPFRWLHGFGGASATWGMYNVEREERLVSAQGNDLIPPVKNEKPIREKPSFSYYGGIEPKLGRMGLRAFGGKNTRNGWFVGAGTSFRVNGRK